MATLVLTHSKPAELLKLNVGHHLKSIGWSAAPTESKFNKPLPPPSTSTAAGVSPKSCLKRKTKNSSSSGSGKQVIFADAIGRPLTRMRTIPAREQRLRDELQQLKPPLQLTQRLLLQLATEYEAHGVGHAKRRSTTTAPPPAPPQWAETFSQPAADYLRFRAKLEAQHVCLEHVVLHNDQCLMTGTVKVQNLAYRKLVLVRATTDNWQSYQDVFCSYVPLPIPKFGLAIYDTFSFQLTLPPPSSKLEFCVCYRSDAAEFWDNNEHNNYVIKKLKRK